MSVPDKRYDRYMLTAYPAVALLAGYALAHMLSEGARQAMPLWITRLAIVVCLALAMFPFPIHGHGTSTYIHARAILDSVNAPDMIATIDKRYPAGYSTEQRQWSVRAQIVFYLDRRLMTYPSANEALEKKHPFLIIQEEDTEEAQSSGYSRILELRSNRWLMQNVALSEQ